MSKRNNDLVKEIMTDYNNRKEARKGLESKWLLNVNFLTGNQFSEILPSGEIRDNGKDYYWQTREVYNHIAPIVETRLAKFTSIAAGVSVRPATGDFNDINAAKFSTLLLKSTEEENDFKKLSHEAIFWSEVCGTSFYKVCWSDAKGRQVAENLCEGDVELSVCPPYEIYPDNLSASDMDGCQSVIHARAYPVERVQDIWGVKVKGQKVDVITPENHFSGIPGESQRARMLTEVKDNYVVVIERYSLPDSTHPDGRFTIVAGDRVLYDGSLPYINKSDGKRGFPFVRQVCLEQPASFFGVSIIDRLIPVQRAYNAIKNRKHEYLNRMAMGVLMVEDGSIDIDDIEQEGLAPGKVVVYRQGSNIPIMLNLGGVPSEFSEEENRLLNEFVTISGVSDFLTSSTIISSNISGVALNLIIEQDNNRLSITTNSIRSAVREVGKQILRLYRQFASTKRLKRISGENGEIEMRSFTGNDITSDDLVFDVENETVGSAASRKTMAEELLQMGLLNDENGKLSEQSKVKLLEIMGFGNWETALNTDELHLKKAARENMEAAKKAPVIEDIDNHNLHIEEHTRYLISAENDLTESDREALREHIRQHRVYFRLSKEADLINQNTI